MAVLQRATEKPAGSIFIFNFTVADFAMANELELMAVYIIWEMVVISASWTEFQKIDGAWWQDTHSQNTSAQHSLFTSAERTPRAWLKSHGLQCHLCAPEESSHLVSHMSHPLLLSHLPFTWEHIIFLIHSSFYHDTRTRSTTGATRSPPRTPSSSCASPSSPSRQAAPSRIALAWKPAEWRKPAHDNSHRNNIFLVLSMTWKGTRRNVWKDIANLQRKRLNNETKSQHHAWMTINLKKKEWVSRRTVCSLLTNCSEMSVFSSYWETWHFVVCEQACACYNKMDKIFCFKTLILQETLKTQNQHQEEFCAFSEVTRLCQ